MSAIGDYIHLTYAGYAGFRGTPGPYLRNADMVIKKHKKIEYLFNNLYLKYIFIYLYIRTILIK